LKRHNTKKKNPGSRLIFKETYKKSYPAQGFPLEPQDNLKISWGGFYNI
jgi:hypothetical protein